jgi:hypothetical protein
MVDKPKDPRTLSEDDIAREMAKRADTLDHLTARAEMEHRRSRYMRASAIATSVSATAAAIAAIVAASSPITAADDISSSLRGRRSDNDVHEDFKA